MPSLELLRRRSAVCDSETKRSRLSRDVDARTRSMASPCRLAKPPKVETPASASRDAVAGPMHGTAVVGEER